MLARLKRVPSRRQEQRREFRLPRATSVSDSCKSLEHDFKSLQLALLQIPSERRTVREFAGRR